MEDAPALDALPTFKVTERDGAIYVHGEESLLKSGKRSPSFKRTKAPGPDAEKVVVVGGGSGAIGLVEGLRENGFGGATSAKRLAACRK